MALTKLRDLKYWTRLQNPLGVNTSAGFTVITDTDENSNLSLMVNSSTSQFLYHHDEDSVVQIPSMALAGTFGAGVCGSMRRWSNTLTANGGTTASITTTAAINGLAKGKTIQFLTGANAGLEAIVTGVSIVAGGTSTLFFNTLPSAIVNTDTFVVDTGLFLVMGAGTIAAGIFKSYDPLTGVTTTLSNTGLPATWGTDGRLVSTSSKTVFCNGLTLAATSTTIVSDTFTWAVNKWVNYQVRITGGTGKGQKRTIISNSAAALTVSAWTVTPDNTSAFEIIGDDDKLYLFGNNAVTVYKYSFATNTWTTLAPTTARAGAIGLGGSANWVTKTNDSFFDDPETGRAGRYIYSFRGGGSNSLDVLDITGGTAGAMSWSVFNYNTNGETFTAGSSFALSGKYIYCRKDSTYRVLKYSIIGNYMEAFSWNQGVAADGTPVVGDKTWVKNLLNSDGTVSASWLYCLDNTGVRLFRVLII